MNLELLQVFLKLTLRHKARLRGSAGGGEERSNFNRNYRKNDLNEGSNGSDSEHEGSFEIRRDELEAIQGIYPDGVVIYEPVLEKSLGEFNVIVKPTVEEDQKIL